MSGYTLICKIRQLEEECDKLGFQMCHARHYYREFGDVVALKPKADCLPVYSRDAELFVGSLADLERWVQGFQFARKYDSMLFGAKHEEKRVKKEVEFRHGRLVRQLKDLKGTDNEQEQ